MVWWFLRETFSCYSHFEEFEGFFPGAHVVKFLKGLLHNIRIEQPADSIEAQKGPLAHTHIDMMIRTYVD